MKTTVTMDLAEGYLLSCIEELEWAAEYRLHSAFMGSFLVLQALGRACMMDPSSLLYCFLPEKYGDDDIKEALKNIDARPMYLCLNKDDDEYKIELIYDDPESHLKVKYTTDIYIDAPAVQNVVVCLDAVEFVQDLREVIARVFEYARQDKTFLKKLKVAFNEYKFMGFN